MPLAVKAAASQWDRLAALETPDYSKRAPVIGGSVVYFDKL